MAYINASLRRPKGINLATSRWLWFPPALLYPLAVSGPNFALGIYAILVLALGLRLLWRPGEPPILLFIFIWQWMQSATGALYGNAIGVPIADLHFYRGQHEFASSLMLTGVLVLALAMRFAAGRQRLDLSTCVKTLVLTRPFRFWFRIYVMTWVFSAACGAIAPMAGGLRLPFLTMADLKWVGFILLTFSAFTRPSRSARIIWILVFGIEFVLSVGGFFSSFKEVFYFAMIGLAASSVRFGPKILISGALLVITMLTLSVVWTAVKVEYRAFVNAGTGYQVVLVDRGERFIRLGQLIEDIDGFTLQRATEQMFERVMYHTFFGAAAESVPSIQPHSYGQIWGEAIIRPLMPRLLFPNKSAIHDSDWTNHYTGLGVATADQGTTISLGYMAEAYIDFGSILMFLPIAFLGFGVGAFYRWLLNQPGYRSVVGASLAPFALMPAHLAETSILKMIPSLVLTFLASVVVFKLLAPMVLRGISRANLLDRP